MTGAIRTQRDAVEVDVQVVTLVPCIRDSFQKNGVNVGRAKARGRTAIGHSSSTEQRGHGRRGRCHLGRNRGYRGLTSRSRIARLHGDRLRVQLAAPPVDAAANDELVALLADVLGVPKRIVAIVRGHTGKRKTIRIDGADGESVRRVLEGAT